MILNKLLISREQAFLICDKSQYCEATLWEKIKLNFRYIWCRGTRAYVIRNRKLTKAMKSSNVDCMEYAERKLLEDRFNDQLKNEM